MDRTWYKNCFWFLTTCSFFWFSVIFLFLVWLRRKYLSSYFTSLRWLSNLFLFFCLAMYFYHLQKHLGENKAILRGFLGIFCSSLLKNLQGIKYLREIYFKLSCGKNNLNRKYTVWTSAKLKTIKGPTNNIRFNHKEQQKSLKLLWNCPCDDKNSYKISIP